MSQARHEFVSTYGRSTLVALLVLAWTARSVCVAQIIRVAPGGVELNGGTPAQQFDGYVWEDYRPEAQTKALARFEHLLDLRIASIDRRYRLSPLQKEQLKLAGRGDISRFSDRVDRARDRYVDACRRDDDKDAGAALEAAAALREELKPGPFGAGSLFDKVAKAMLLPEQLEGAERRHKLALNSTAKITAHNVWTLETVGRFPKNVYRVEWTRNNEIALLGFDRALEIYSAKDLRPLRTIGDGRKLVAFDFSPDGNFVALGENSTKAFLVNLSNGEERILDTNSPQPSVCFSPNGRLLATGGCGMRVALWSVETGKQIASFAGEPADGGLTPVFSPDGKILAIGNRNAKTWLFDVETRRSLSCLPRHSSQELKFDPAGKRLAVAYVDADLAVWDVKSGNLSQHAQGRAKELYSLDWSPDGSLIATAGRDGSIVVWKAADLTPLVEFEAPEWVICVRFNREGTRLLYAGGAANPSGPRYVEILAVPPE